MGSESIDKLTETVELIKRHGALHLANIKYGYFVLGTSLLYIGFRYFTLWYYHKLWSETGRSTTNLRLVNMPWQLGISLLVLVVSILILVEPHYDHIATHIRRMGRISYALVPLDLFLAARPAWIPMDNYLNTIRLHKWVSRLIVILAIVHGVGFLFWYNAQGTPEKIIKVSNIYGIVVLITSCIIFCFWKPARNFNYSLFYVIHNIFLLSFVILIALHSKPGVSPIFFINIILLFVQIVKKYGSAKDVTFTEIIEHPNSQFKIVKFPKKLLPENYLPGCHIRVGYGIWHPFFLLLPSHPYTVATTYEDRDMMSSLIIKETRYQIIPFETYSIQLDFKSSLPQQFFETAENVTIVCGGSGISFGMGIFEFFKMQINRNGKDIKIKFIWITKSENDLYILNHFNIKGAEVFITNSDSFDNIQNLDNTDVELDTLTDPFADPGKGRTSVNNAVAVGFRPNLEELITPHLNETIDYSNKWIISCGPESLNKDCQKLALKTKCRFFSENYTF